MDVLSPKENNSETASSEVSPATKLCKPFEESVVPSQLTSKINGKKKRKVSPKKTVGHFGKVENGVIEKTEINTLNGRDLKRSLSVRSDKKLGSVLSVEGDIDQLPVQPTTVADAEGEDDLYEEPAVENAPKINFALCKSLQKCNNHRDFFKALQVMHLCHSNAIELTVEVGTLFVKAGCKLGLGKEVLDNLRQNSWITILLSGVNYLLIHFSIKKDFRSLGRLVSLCKRRSIILNAESWHIIVRALVEDNRIDDALVVLADISIEHKLVPQRATFTVIMNALKAQEKNKEIVELYLNMNKLQINPSSTSTSLAVRAHFQLADVDSAVTTLKEYLGSNPSAENFGRSLRNILENTNSNKWTLAQLYDSFAKNDVQVTEELKESLATNLEGLFSTTTEL